MKKFALITAGGSGKRMGITSPKQFIELNGEPVILHSIKRFLNFDPDIALVVVIPEQYRKEWLKTCSKYGFAYPHRVVSGGDTRFHSVKNGLEVIEDEGIVFIHDAVRPLVSMQTIRNCYQLAVEKGNALPVVPVTESLRYADENSTRAVPRSSFFIVQTPQTFHVKLIKEAYQQDFTEYFTDDASVLESAGGIIQLVDGNRENIKITYPDDFVYAQALIGLNKPVKQ